MTDFATGSEREHIDLTREMEVAYWCRILGVTRAQLRDAVHQVGHQASDVRRYLEQKSVKAS